MPFIIFFVIFGFIAFFLILALLPKSRKQPYEKKVIEKAKLLYLDKALSPIDQLPSQQQQVQIGKKPGSNLSRPPYEPQRSDQEIAEILAKRARLTIEHHNCQSNLQEDKDAWEASDLDYGQYEEPAIFEKSGIRESTTKLEIDYVDRNGTRTTRQIRVKRVSFKNDMTDAGIDAFCCERQAGRTFIASRIVRCVDIKTGELITNIPEFLFNAYNESTYGKLERMREEHGDELAALMFVSKADGKSTKIEKRIIASYLLHVAGDIDLSADDILQDLKNEESLSKTQFHRCVGRLARSSSLRRDAFIDAARAIVNTTKTPRASTVEILEYIQRKMK
ncbi:MAG: hypothetical protein FJ083_15125 [Cyanobacteria bacterium K_Offshore_surface_m2_239]|nr:hypothetical protein [Cyanobacteria bacterium K_Offshore_surface_m2_239]